MVVFRPRSVQATSVQTQRLSDACEHLNEVGLQSSNDIDELSYAGRQLHESVSPYSISQPQSPTSEGLVDVL